MPGRYTAHYLEGWPAPTITTVAPPSGPVLTVITITGTDYQLAQGTGTVTVGGLPAAVTSWSNTVIVATVPAGLAPGAWNVVVQQGGQTSNNGTFTIPSTGGNALDIVRVPPQLREAIAGNTVGKSQVQG